ncbi:MAG: hypothetical protein QXR44_06050 [Thermoproteota archaeon]
MKFRRKIVRYLPPLAVASTLMIAVLLLPYLLILGQQYPIIITLVRTLDMTGNPQTSFPRGSNVAVESTIQSQAYAYGPPLQYLLIVQITDPNDYVVFIGFITDVIPPGGTKTAGSGYLIPVGATVGDYTVDVYVWNGWPSQMGGNFQPLSAPGRTTFQVT